MKNLILIAGLILSAYQTSFAADSIVGTWQIDSEPSCQSGKTKAQEVMKDIGFENEAPARVELKGSVTFEQNSVANFDIQAFLQISPIMFEMQMAQLAQSKQYIDTMPDEGVFPSKKDSLKLNETQAAELAAMKDGVQCHLKFSTSYSGSEGDFAISFSERTFEECSSPVSHYATAVPIKSFLFQHAQITKQENGRIITSEILGGNDERCIQGDRAILVLK